VTRNNGTRGKISFSFSAVSRPHCGSPAISKPPDQGAAQWPSSRCPHPSSRRHKFQIRRGTETPAEAFHTKHFRYQPVGRVAITLLRAVRAVDARNNPSEYWGTRPLVLALGTIKSRWRRWYVRSTPRAARDKNLVFIMCS
jgi:hypothetical protein